MAPKLNRKGPEICKENGSIHQNLGLLQIPFINCWFNFTYQFSHPYFGKLLHLSFFTISIKRNCMRKSQETLHPSDALPHKDNLISMETINEPLISV